MSNGESWTELDLDEMKEESLQDKLTEILSRYTLADLIQHQNVEEQLSKYKQFLRVYLSMSTKQGVFEYLHTMALSYCPTIDHIISQNDQEQIFAIIYEFVFKEPEVR